VWSAYINRDPNVAIPNGSWFNVSSSGYPGYPPQPGFGSKSLSALVVVNVPPDLMMWHTPAGVVPGSLPEDFWGLLSGPSGQNHSVAEYNAKVTTTFWDSPQAGSVAVQIALFKTINPQTNLPAQIPWVLQNTGDIFSYYYPTKSFVHMAGAATSLTDHYVVGSIGGIPSGIYKWDDNAESWDYITTNILPNGNWITQLAYSGAVTVNGSTWGPSELWGLDNTGAIYFLSGYPD
jgi:hypothetical protein